MRYLGRGPLEWDGVDALGVIEGFMEKAAAGATPARGAGGPPPGLPVVRGCIEISPVPSATAITRPGQDLSSLAASLISLRRSCVRPVHRGG